MVGATCQRSDLVTAPQGRRRRSGACTGEFGIVQDRATMRNEGVAERQGCELFNTSQGKQRIRIVIGRFGGGSFAFRLPVGELLVVDVNRFQPSSLVVERGVRPDVLERDKQFLV
eukprot:3749265-Pleurochrysis_carterae.AAC.1